MGKTNGQGGERSEGEATDYSEKSVLVVCSVGDFGSASKLADFLRKGVPGCKTAAFGYDPKGCPVEGLLDATMERHSPKVIVLYQLGTCGQGVMDMARKTSPDVEVVVYDELSLSGHHLRVDPGDDSDLVAAVEELSSEPSN